MKFFVNIILAMGAFLFGILLCGVMVLAFEKLLTPPQPEIENSSRERKYAQGYWETSPYQSKIPKPGNHRSFLKVDGQYIYDVIYSVDQYHRRITPSESLRNPKHHILFFGGSFKYSVGAGHSW